MNKIYVVLAVSALLVTACDERKQFGPEEKLLETKQARETANLLGKSWGLAKNNKPEGFLKLFEIAENIDSKYGAGGCCHSDFLAGQMLLDSDKMQLHCRDIQAG